jgi:tetratricopeptide (TPR) repeat protein
MRHRVASTLVLVLFLAPREAPGAPAAAAQAKKLFEQGNVHFNLGEYRTALQRYRDAYTVKPLPGFLFNIGQCHYNLEEYDKAIAAYERYLSEQPSAPNRAVVQAQIENARAALARRREAEAARHAASQPAAGSAEDTQPAERPADAPPAAAPVSPEPPAAEPASDGAPRPSLFKKAILWTGVALSGALLATGAITRGLALSMANEYKQPTTPLERQLTLADRGETLTAASNVTLIAGAAAALGTGLYYWFGYRARRAAPKAALSAALLPDDRGALVSVHGAF